MIFGACGSGTDADDKALFDKVTAMWTDQDAAAAKEIFAADANLYWNWSAEPGNTPEMQTGIDEISALVASGQMGHPTPVGDDVFAYEPSAKDIENLSVAYDGARYIAGPVYVARGLYLVVLEVRDGKAQNLFVEALY
jgi:hypothetical protein